MNEEMVVDYSRRAYVARMGAAIAAILLAKCAPIELVQGIQPTSSQSLKPGASAEMLCIHGWYCTSEEVDDIVGVFGAKFYAD